MVKNNICKFVVPNVTNSLNISNFIFESNKETMLKSMLLTHHRLILLTAGKCVISLNNTKIYSNVGCVVFGFKGETICVEPEENTEYMYISFDGIRSGEIFERFGIDKENRCFSEFQGLIPLWKESLYNSNEITIDLAAESILLYTFSCFVSQAIKQESAVGKTIEITKTHFSDPTLSISVIADELGYNAKYLSHTFKTEMKITYSEYLRNIRLKYAISLFDNGIDSVKNVALLSGFSDPLYFSTVFKKSTGVTPKEYKIM